MTGEGHAVAGEWAKDLVDALVDELGVEETGGGVTLTSRAAMVEVAEGWINDHSFLFVDEDGGAILN